MRRGFVVVAAVSVLFLLGGCGGGSRTPPPQITVTISPTLANVSTGQTKQFTATVTGTANTAVSWQVNGVTGGNSTIGTISANGLYTAPSAVPIPATVTVTAVSQADSSKSASASVTIAAQVTVVVSPGSATVLVFQTVQFSATVNGTPTTAVTWQANCPAGSAAKCGSISSSGLYTAPNSVPVTSTSSGGSTTATVTVTAIPQSSPGSSGSAVVTVVAPNQQARTVPVPLGVSGGNANDSSTSGRLTTCCGGTLGSLVSRGGKQFILSNNHVLARSDIATVGDPIIQPGLVDADCSSAGTTTVANLSQFFNLETGAAPKVDAAIAQIVSGKVDPNGTILQLGGTTSGGLPTDGPPHAGSGVAPMVSGKVAKSGRSTGLTCSAIQSISVTVSVQYQKGCGTGTAFSETFTNQVQVMGGDFSAEGDSGSLIVTQDTADPVALLFAESSTDTVGNPISDVLNAVKDPQTAEKPIFVGSASAHIVAACSLPGPQAAMTSRLTLQKAEAPSEALQRAANVRDLHGPELLAHPEVQALGIGASLDRPGEPALLFFVTKGQPRTGIPAQVEGIRTRIIEGDLFARRGVLSAAESAALEETAAPAVSALPDAEIARARAVHAAHVEELMRMPGVQGVGITSSADSPGEAALMIFLIRGVPHGEVPPVIDGLRTRVKESSRFRAGFGDARPQRLGPATWAAPQLQPQQPHRHPDSHGGPIGDVHGDGQRAKRGVQQRSDA